MTSISRRRFLAAGAGVAGLAAEGLLGLSACGGEAVRGRPAQTSGESGVAPPAGAKVRTFDATATSTPTSTPRPTATPSPTPTPTPTPISRPEWPLDVRRQVAYSGPSNRPEVAVTVDDGWSNRDAVLDTLKSLMVPLTFFLAGRAIRGDYGFVARALDAGCEVGNHTMSHYTLTNKSADYIRKDLQDFEDVVQAAVGKGTTKPYMRPSGGLINATVTNTVAEAGYRPILWSVSSGDGSSGTTAEQMVRNVVAGARPGSIVLMHFSARAVAALPGIVAGLRGKGLEPVTLSRLFAEG